MMSGQIVYVPRKHDKYNYGVNKRSTLGACNSEIIIYKQNQ